MFSKPVPLHMQLARQLASISRPLPLRKILEMSFVAEMSETQVYYQLQKGREAGLLLSEGVNRHARWQASSQIRLTVLREQINEPLEKKPRVTYDPVFLEEYVPNKTFYLSDDQRSRLHQRSPLGSAVFQSLNDHDRSTFMCGLTSASSAMEGANYNLAATNDLITAGLKMANASETETTIVLNHHEAIRYLIDNAHYPVQDSDVAVSAMDIKGIHALVSYLLLKDERDCGAIRKTPVQISQSSFVPLSVQGAIERSFDLMIKKSNKITDPFERSFFLLVHLPYLQPFVDCNKRTARISCNIPLLRSGVVPMSWLDVAHQDFTDGVLGVYERCNPTLLAEVFFDGYMRSTERFDIMCQTAKPDALRVKYRAQIKQAVTHCIFNGTMEVPENVLPADRPAFEAMATDDLNKLDQGHAQLMIMYRLSEGDVEHWRRQRPGLRCSRER
jgi:hypothetical protein